MNTVAIDEFAKKIAPMAETCPNFVVRNAVVDTIADICKKTNVLTGNSLLMTRKGENTYRIPTETDIVPLQVRGAFCGGERLYPVHYDELVSMFNGDFSSEVGKPRYFFNRRPNWIIFYPCPDEAYEVSLDLTLSLARTMKSASVPDVFYTYYLDSVVWGALGRIYRIAGQAYTNVRLADQYDMRYFASINEIKHDATREFTRSSGHVPFRRII